MEDEPLHSVAPCELVVTFWFYRSGKKMRGRTVWISGMYSTTSTHSRQSASWAAHCHSLLLPTFPVGTLSSVTGTLPAGLSFSVWDVHALWTFPGCITEQVPFVSPHRHTEIPIHLWVPLGKRCLLNCEKQLRAEWAYASLWLIAHFQPCLLLAFLSNAQVTWQKRLDDSSGRSWLNYLINYYLGEVWMSCDIVSHFLR